MPGTACDDGDSNTANDSWMLDCTCTGQLVDCAGVVGGTAALDGCGVCAGGTTGVIPDGDSDGDGLVSCDDICPDAFNPDQADFDGDGVGDACDNCVWVSNSDQVDANGNGIGDACETLNGIPEVTETSGLSIYPNPADEEIYVTCTDAQVRAVRIVDVAGALVLQAPVMQRIDLNNVARGTYIVIALNAEGRPLAQTRLIRQ